MKKIFPAIVILLILFVQTGCGPALEKATSSAVNGAESNGKIDSLTAQAMKGLIDQLTNGASSKKLDSLIGSIGHKLRLSTDSIVLDLKDTVITLRDSILGKYLEEHAATLVETITGAHLRNNLSLLRDDLLGKTTKKKVDGLITSAINTALSDSTRYKLNHLLDSLGATASSRVALLVDTAVAHIITGTNKIGVNTNNEITSLQRHVIPLLACAAGIIVIATGLIIYFFRRKEKYAKLSGLLAYQIHETRSDSVFNDLKNRISDNAKKDSLEPTLRDLLSKKGMLGDQTRSTVSGRTV